MANKLDPMDLKQIISLHLDNVSNRKIASTLGISRNTVNTYMKLFTGSEYSFEDLITSSSAVLNELFSAQPLLILIGKTSSCSTSKEQIKPDITPDLRFNITTNSM